MIPAFARGVRFGCTACGKCCTKLKGDLPLTHDDVVRVSAHLKLSVRAFVAKYCRHVVDVVRTSGRTVRMPSIELRVPPSGRCVFLDDTDRCSIHEAKPFICSQTPFMAFVAEGSPGVWDEARSYCPGVGQGEWFSRKAIDRLLQEERDVEQGDHERLRTHRGSLARVFGCRLPRPVVRRWNAPAHRTVVKERH